MKREDWKRMALPPLVVAGGVIAAGLLVATKPEPERRSVEAPIPRVETLRVELRDEAMRIEAFGTVVPAQQVRLMPELSGRLVEVSPKLQPGGSFDKGEVVAKIDPRSFQLAIDSQRAKVEEARFELEVEQGRARVAEREWALLEKELATDEAGRRLALREPHLANLRARVAAAESDLERTRLELSRTVLRAPFNSVVGAEEADVGQLVTPQSQIATLTGSDTFWARATLPLSDLHWLELPTDDRPGAPARILHESSLGPPIERSGRLLHVYPSLEVESRLAQVLVEIDDPIGRRKTAAGERAEAATPMLVGSYVRVELKGREVADVAALPRAALRENNSLWMVSAEDALEIRKVEVIARRGDEVLVRGGVATGDRVITSSIAGPIAGMRVRAPAP